MVDQHFEYPAKRRRISIDPAVHLQMEPPSKDSSDADQLKTVLELDEDHGEMENITISSSSKQANQAIAPFLVEHIPEQYAPWAPSTPAKTEPSTKYCYRHRPDLKCRRQANEPSMEQLQHVRIARLSSMQD